MTKFENFFVMLWSKKFFKKIIAYVILVSLFYFFRDFLWVFLLTFIFAYLFYSSGKYLRHKGILLLMRSSLDPKWKRIIETFVPLNSVVLLQYIIFVSLLIFIISTLIPQLLGELYDISKTVPFLSDQVNSVASKLEEVKILNTEIGLTVNEIVSESDMSVIKTFIDTLQAFGIVFLQFVLALVLSFVFIIDRKRVENYFGGLKSSSFGFLYEEYSIIFRKIVKSFGLVLKAQSLIALCNTIITMIGFYLIGLFYGGFPYLLTMGVIVFFASFIPILGMWISAVPLSIIAYINGGIDATLLVLIMIISTTAFEVYFLNPKIVSSLFKLPVSLTFLILFISEQFFGVAGLLIGVSLFYFIISLFSDFDNFLLHEREKKS